MNTKISKGTRNRIAVWCVTAVFMYYITYRLSLKEALLPFSSDMVTHMKYALSFDHVIKLSHNLWHFVCWVLYACLPIDITRAAAAATALFNAVTGVLTLCFAERILKPDYEKADISMLCFLLAGASLVAGPLYLRFYNMRYYLGQGTPNPWHNPTSIAVRPFLLALCLLTVDYWSLTGKEKCIIGGREYKKTLIFQVVMGIVLALGTIAKPCILMVYFPACALIALVRLIRKKGKQFLPLIVSHLYFVPSLLILLWQYAAIYISDRDSYLNSSKIVVDFFYTARLYADSVIISLLLRMAFPFLVIVLWRKAVGKDPLFRLIFLQYVFGLLITWTFRETGRRANHGNFGWGNVLASSLLWIYCTAVFVRELLGAVRAGDVMDRESRWKQWRVFLLPACLLLWHIVAGICYYIMLLHDMGIQL